MAGLDAALDVLHLFGDPSRVRLMALLSREELAVAELVSITGLAQSRVSTHLGKLRDAGILRDRRVGASTFYTASDGVMPEQARKLWSLLESDVVDPVLEEDGRRCDELLHARDGATSWPDTVAGQMERHYSPGRTWEATARGLLGFVRLGDVLDVGSGDGAITQLFAPRAKTVTCVDRSERMISAAKKRLDHFSHVKYRVGDMQELPSDDGAFDEVIMHHVLTYSPAPARAVEEAARVLRPGGRLSLVTLKEHAHREITAQYSHLQPGFSLGALTGWIAGAALDVEFCEVTSRERRKPYFEVITAFARRSS